MIQVWESGFRFWFGIKVCVSGLVFKFQFTFGIYVWESGLGFKFGIKVWDLGFIFKWGFQG